MGLENCQFTVLILNGTEHIHASVPGTKDLLWKQRRVRAGVNRGLGTHKASAVQCSILKAVCSRIQVLKSDLIDIVSIKVCFGVVINMSMEQKHINKWL